MIPYSLQVFITLLSEHVAAVWPWPAISLLVAFILMLFISLGFAFVSSFVSIYLAFIWAWVGIVYHIRFYASLNWAGTLFGVMFLAQAILIIWFTFVRSPPAFQLVQTKTRILAIPVLIYLLVMHPFLGKNAFNLVALGDLDSIGSFDFSGSYQLVGVTPDATNLFTLAVFSLSVSGVSRLVLVIPLLWCLFSVYWAWLLGAFGKLLLPTLSILILAMLIANSIKQQFSGTKS